MEPSNTQKEDLPTAFNGIKSQLNSILKSNQLFQDYALLNGFLAFVHSKLNAAILTSIESQCGKSFAADLDSFDQSSISSILDFSWESVHYPIFKWFQMWRNYILFEKENKKQQTKFIDFRKMNSKMLKFFKTVQNFYVNVINTVYKKYDISVLLPKRIIQDLKLSDIENTTNVGDSLAVKTFNSSSPLAHLIPTLFHRCLLFLGTAYRYKTLLEEISNKYSISNFKKSLDFFRLASLVLPSAGETYSQAGAIFLQTGNLGIAVFNFVKGMMTKMPSPVSIKNFGALMVDNKSSLNRSLHTTIMNTYLQESKGPRTPAKEILEFYFLGLFGSVWSPTSWRDDTKPNQLNNGIKLRHLENALYETMSARYLNNIKTIFHNLIITIGGFHLLLKRRSDVSAKTLKDLRSNELDYLNFAFKYIAHILNDIVKESWSENPEVSEILGMVRIINCWIKANPMVLQYSQSNLEFVNALAYLINDIVKKKPSPSFSITEHIPKRTYWFEEDLMVKGLSFVNFQLSDFDDYEKILEMDHSLDRLIGNPPLCDKLSASSEMLLRLQAVVNISPQLLQNNNCGVEWSDNKSRYIFNKKIGFKETVKNNMKTSKQSNEKAKLQRKNKPSTTNGSISMADLERQMRSSSLDSFSPTMGYSGSSVPMAPDTFNVKPSGTITGNKVNVELLKIELSGQNADGAITNISPGYSNAAISSSNSTDESSFDLNNILSSMQQKHAEKSFAKSMQGVNEQIPANDVCHQAQRPMQGGLYSSQQPSSMSSLNSAYQNASMPPSASMVSYPYPFLNQQGQGVFPPYNAQNLQWQSEAYSLKSMNFANPTWLGDQHQTSAPSSAYAQAQRQMFQQHMQQDVGKYMQFPFDAQSNTDSMRGSSRNNMF